MTEILKTWQAYGLTCKLWREPSGAFRGCVFVKGTPVSCAETQSSTSQADAEAAVEALAALRVRHRGIGVIKDSTPIVDVVMELVPPMGVPEGERLRESFAITSELEVIPVDWEVFHAITAACDPPGVNRGKVADLRAPLYAFVRINAPRSPYSAWDSDEKLQLGIALSRLVRPTSIGFEFAVRLVGDVRSGEFELIPGPVRGFGAQAWTSQPEHDWLSPADLLRLRSVASAFFSDPFPASSRVQQALWFFEYAARTGPIDIRWLFVATAIETLLSTDPSQSTRHFTRRLSQLADALGTVSVSKDEASRMWGLRSAISHGSKHGGLGETDFAIYRKVEEVLRASLERAVVDKTFRGIFSDEKSINIAFPVDPPQKKEAKCPACGTEFEAAP